MCDPVTLTAVAIGAGIGAGTAAATGGDPLMGAIMGGATGAFFPGGFGVSPTAFGPQLAGTFTTGFGSSVAIGGVASAAGIGLVAGSVLNPILNPPTFDVPQQTAQVSQFQQLNSTPYAITGSGGKQASSSLAEAISRTKKRKLTQDDVSDLSIDTSSFSSTGLQFA